MTIPNNDFLALTLENENSLEPFQFGFKSGTGYVEDTGILRLEPNNKSSIHLVLSVGIHGNETGPIEMLSKLLSDILEGRLMLRIRLLVLIGNPVAANLGKRFCDVNLNRLFSGAWVKYDGFESKRAKRLERAVSEFFAADKDEAASTRLHYDLHTAIRKSTHEKFVVAPYVEEAVYSKEQFSFLAASGIDAILLSHQPTSTFSYYSYSVHGAHAFTVELGRVFPFGGNDLTRFSEIEGALTQLIQEGTFSQSSLSNLKVFSVLDALVKDDEDYQLNISEDVKNFAPFKEGYVLAQSKKSQYLIKNEGDAIVFPNTNLPVGQRAGLIVRPIKEEDLHCI